jgi:predicted MFS family arabinose efflux permease
MNHKFVIFFIASCIGGMLFSLFLPTLPLYAETMTGTTVWAGLVSGTFSVSALLVRPFAGILCAHFDNINLTIIGMAVMTLSCIMYNWTAAIGILIVVRVMHGMAFGLKTTASGAVVADMIPEGRIAEGIGIFGLYLPLTNIIGPACGLMLIDTKSGGGFSYLFAAAFVMGLISTALCFSIRHRKSDTHTNKSVSVNERSTKDPNLPKTLFGFERGVLVPFIILVLTYIPQGCIITFTAIYCREQGWAGVQWFFVLSSSSLFVFRLVYARTVARIGYDKWVLVGAVVFVTGVVCIPFMQTMPALCAIAVVTGFGLAPIPAALNAMMLERCTKRRMGSAQAAYTSALDIGVGAGAMVMGFVLESVGFAAMYISGAAFAAIAAFLYVVFLRGGKKFIAGLNPDGVENG